MEDSENEEKVCLPCNRIQKIGNKTFIISNVFEDKNKTLETKMIEFLKLQKDKKIGLQN